MRLMALLTMGLYLAACASISPVEVNGPKGKPAFSMECSGFGRTLEACYKKAGELCPSGYNIIDRASSVVGIPQSNGSTMMAPQHSLFIECK